MKMYMREDLCDLPPSVFHSLPTARSKILQSDEASHSSNQRSATGIDGCVKQIKTSLTLLWQSQRITRCFCFPCNCLSRRWTTSSTQAPSSLCVSSPSPPVVLHTLHSLQPLLYCNPSVCSRTRPKLLISLFVFLLLSCGFSAPNKTLLVRRTVCVFRVNYYLFNSPWRTVLITSKQKFQLLLRALWARGYRGNSLPTSRAVSSLFLKWNKHLQMNNWFYLQYFEGRNGGNMHVWGSSKTHLMHK